MEYCDYDLKSLLENKIKFKEPEVKYLMFQILKGVAYLHDNWIMHRDFKTSNLLITKDSIVKICDFGMVFKLFY
jgi:cell division cycle 2-like